MQILVLSMVLGSNKFINPVILRRQSHKMLQDMMHTNGMISMRAWKKYLLLRGFTHEEHVSVLLSKI